MNDEISLIYIEVVYSLVVKLQTRPMHMHIFLLTAENISNSIDSHRNSLECMHATILLAIHEH